MRKAIFFGSIAACLLSACGGGSSGGNSGSFAPLEITADNATRISAAVATSATNAGGDFGSDFFVASGSPDKTLNTAPLSKVATEQMLAQVNSALSLTIQPTTENCQVSGTITVSGQVANAEGVSSGDRISSTFNACNDGESTISGSMTIVFSAVSGDFPLGDSFTLSVSMSLDNFTSTENVGGETFSIDGDFSVVISHSPSEDQVTLSTNWLSVSDTGRELALEDFESDESVNNMTLAYSSTVFGTLHDSDLNGSVDFDTVVAFEGVGDGWPESGVMEIVGAGGASITFTALSGGLVSIEVDLDGDGLIDVTINSDWDSLEAELDG